MMQQLVHHVITSIPNLTIPAIVGVVLRKVHETKNLPASWRGGFLLREILSITLH
jgi:hypothetical protein